LRTADEKMLLRSADQKSSMMIEGALKVRWEIAPGRLDYLSRSRTPNSPRRAVA